MSDPRLTERQTQVLAFIREFTAGHGFPPTLKEIGTHFVISSTHGVHCHLQALVDKGYLARAAKTARGLRVLEQHPLPTPRSEIMKTAGGSIGKANEAIKVPAFLTRALVEPVEGVSLKRAAWAYGVAKTGSPQEALLLERFKVVAIRELGIVPKKG